MTHKFEYRNFLSALIVALIGGLFSFILVRFDKKEDLICTYDDPVELTVLKDISMKIDDKTVIDLFTYEIRLHNSGNEDIKELVLTAEFKSEPPSKQLSEDFKIYNVMSQKDEKKYLVGDVTEDVNKHEPTKRVFQCSVLKPKGKVKFTLLTNSAAVMEPYVLGFKCEKLRQSSKWPDTATIVAVNASLLSLYLLFGERLRKIFLRRNNK